MLKQLRLNTLQNARKAFSSIIRGFHKGDITESDARVYGYLFAQYLAYLRAEKDVEIERRLEAIEQAVNREN